MSRGNPNNNFYVVWWWCRGLVILEPTAQVSARGTWGGIYYQFVPGHVTLIPPTASFSSLNFGNPAVTRADRSISWLCGLFFERYMDFLIYPWSLHIKDGSEQKITTIFECDPRLDSSPLAHKFGPPPKEISSQPKLSSDAFRGWFIILWKNAKWKDTQRLFCRTSSVSMWLLNVPRLTCTMIIDGDISMTSQ